MWEDPIVADVRRVRQELAARFNYRVSAIFADLRSKQARLGLRLVRGKRRQEGEQAAAPDDDSATLHPGR